MFLRQFLIFFTLFTGMQITLAQAELCSPKNTLSALKNIVPTPETKFNPDTFTADVKRLQTLVAEGELERINPAHLNSNEAKLALFEVLTTHEGEPLFHFDQLTAHADEDQMKRITRVLNRFTPDVQGKLPVLSTRQTIEDLYWLSHPATRTLKNSIFGRAGSDEVNRLIEARVKFAFAHTKIEDAVKELGWADTRNSARMKVWLSEHPTAKSALLISARDSVSAVAPEVVSHFTGIPAFAMPWQSYLGLPGLKLVRPAAGDLELLGEFGHADVMPFLLNKYKTRAQAELAYRYYVRPAIYAGTIGYMVADNWESLKNSAHLLHFGKTVFMLSNQSLADAQAKLSLSEAQKEQIHQALLYEFSNTGEVISPTRMWDLVQDNITLKKSDLYQNYTSAKKPVLNDQEAVPLTAEFIEKTGLQVLGALRQKGLVDGKQIQETQNSFVQWMDAQKDFQKALPQSKPINLVEAETIAHAVLLKNHTPDDPDTVRILVLESLQSQVDQTEYTKLKKEYADKRISRAPN